MKSTVRIWVATMMFGGALGVPSVHATNASPATYRKPVEVTGCLQQGPAAKEYLIHASDGRTWGINEADMMMNNYVDQTVTIVGDAVRPTADERADGGAQHYLKAMDLVVESETCHR